MKRTARRMFCIVAAALLLISLASGISIAKRKTVIIHWQHHTPARQEMVEAFAIEFMKQNPDIEIKIESIPEADYFQKLLPALAAGSGPDTFQIPAGQVLAYARTGVLQPLDTSIPEAKSIEADFMASAASRLKIDGKYYGFPVDTATVVLFYNPKLFKEAGLDPNKPPQTWDELVKYAKAMTKRDAAGVTTQMGVATGGYGPVIISLMLQNGATLWDAKSDLPDFNSKQAAEALQWSTALVADYKVEDRAMGSRWNAFRQEKLAMVFAGPAMIGSFKATAPNLDFRIAEVPAPKAGGSKSTLLTSWAYVTAKKAQSDAATKWVAYLTSESAQKQWILKTGDLPTRKALLDLADYKKDPLLAPCMESMKKATSAPWSARSLDDALIRKAYELVLLKGNSPESALSYLTTEAVKAEKEQKELAMP
ncbi:MAG: ABC transporter substrate-binding protein [Clostridia bacterium]|nr:ABC transporter substrate-binding protein [Clostridia bacterium]